MLLSNVLFQLYCVLILYYRYIGEDFTLGAPKTHGYIGNIVISKIVVSGFCPIHFTASLKCGLDSADQ